MSGERPGGIAPPASILRPGKFFRNIILLIASLSITYGIVYVLIYDEKMALIAFSDLSINAAAAAALVLAVTIVKRQSLGGLHGRTYAAFAIGLALWFTAEIVQTYYEIGVEDEVPFPSIADGFWLAGYAPFGYHLLVTYRFFGKSAKPHSFVIIAATAAAIFGLSVPITIVSSATTNDDLLGLIVNTTYPTLDAVLIVPAIMMFSILRKGRIASVPWVLLSASVMIIAVADSAFGFLAAKYPDSEIWGFSIFYFTGYLCMAGALHCHNRFFIFSKARAVKAWQEENR